MPRVVAGLGMETARPPVCYSVVIAPLVTAIRRDCDFSVSARYHDYGVGSYYHRQFMIVLLGRDLSRVGTVGFVEPQEHCGAR